MADYYSLLARAVAALPQSTPQARQAVFERARAALYNQLRAIQPPVAEAVIENEGRALDEAIARIEAEINAKAAAPAAEPGRPPAAAERPAPEEPEASNERQRPAAPLPPLPERENGSRRVLGIVAILLVLVSVVALAAWHFRERPEDLAKLKPDDQSSGAPESGKLADRVDGDPDAAAAGDTRPRPAGGRVDAIPVAQKAEMWVATAQDPRKVDKIYTGAVVWRLDNVGAGPGQAVGSAIRAEIEFPDAKLKVTLLLQKNLDATLSASHTINIAFKPDADGPIKGVKAIGAPQMRRPDARSGEQLMGIPVPITANSFLIGLVRNDRDQRNVTLLRTFGVIDLPLQTSDGRSANISLEKGPSGERVFSEAFEAWSK